MLRDYRVPKVYGFVNARPRQNFKFVTLSDAEKDAAYKSDPDIALKYGGTLLDQMMAAKHIKVPPNSKPYEQLNAVCK